MLMPLGPTFSDDDRARLLDADYRPSDIDAMDEELVFARTARWVTALEPLLAGSEIS